MDYMGVSTSLQHGGCGQQGLYSNLICKSPVFSKFFPCPTANFPCTNCMFQGCFICKTNLADTFSSLKKKI